MKSHTSLVAQQTRLSEWTELLRDCQNRPQGMNGVSYMTLQKQAIIGDSEKFERFIWQLLIIHKRL